MNEYISILYFALKIIDIIGLIINSPLFRFLIQKLIDFFKDED